MQSCHGVYPCASKRRCVCLSACRMETRTHHTFQLLLLALIKAWHRLVSGCCNHHTLSCERHSMVGLESYCVWVLNVGTFIRPANLSGLAIKNCHCWPGQGKFHLWLVNLEAYLKLSDYDDVSLFTSSHLLRVVYMQC